jgi:hypothetical protein
MPARREGKATSPRAAYPHELCITLWRVKRVHTPFFGGKRFRRDLAINAQQPRLLNFKWLRAISAFHR